MDAEKKKVLLVWVNCLGLGHELTDICQLSDGQHLSKVLEIIWTTNPNHDVRIESTNWIRSLQSFLEDHYHYGLSQLIDFSAISDRNEWEISKATLLLLCASIHCSADRRFVDRLVVLEQADQLLIKALVESVLFDDVSSLNVNFVNLLSRTEKLGSVELCYSRPNSPLTCYETDSDARSEDSQMPISPIRRLLQSPQMLLNVGLRDKERLIHNLESELESERAFRIETESELEKIKNQLEGREVCLKTLTRESNKFHTERLEFERHLQEIQQELTRAKAKILTVDGLTQEVRLLASEREGLVKEKLELEVKVNRLEMAYKTCEKRTRDLVDLRGMLGALQSEANEKDAEIVRLQCVISDLQTELVEERQINADKLKSLQEKLIDKPEPRGEVMSVITEKYLQELKIKHSQIQDEFEEYARTSEQKIADLNYEATSIRVINQQTIGELESERFRSSDLERLLTEVRLNADLEVDTLQRRANERVIELQELCQTTRRNKQITIDDLNAKVNHLVWHVQESNFKLQLVALEVCAKCADIASLEAQVVQRDVDIDALLAAEKSHREAFEKVTLRNMELDSLLHKTVDEKMNLEADLKSCRSDILNLHDEWSLKLTQLNDAQLKYVQDLNSLQQIVDQRNVELEKLRTDAVRQESKLVETESFRSELEKEKAELDVKCEGTKQIIARLEDELHMNDVFFREKLAAVEKDCLEKLDVLAQHNMRLEHDLVDKMGELSTMREDVTRREAQVLAIKGDFMEETDFLKESVQQFNFDLEKVRDDVRSAKSELLETQASKCILEQEKFDLETELSVQKELVGRLEDNVRFKGDKINVLKERYEEVEREKVEIEGFFKASEVAKSALDEELNARLAEISQLHNEVTSKDNEVANTQQRHAALEIKLRETDTSKSEFERKSAVLEANLESKCRLVKQLEDEVRNKDALVQDKFSDNKMLEETSNRLEQERVRLEGVLQKSEEMKKRLEIEIEVRLREISLLRDDITTKDNQVVDIKRRFSETIGTLELKLRETEAFQSKLETEIEVKNQLVGQLTVDACDKDAEMKILKERMEVLALQKVHLEEIVGDIEKAKSDLEEELKSRLVQVSLLQKDVVEKTDQLSDLEAKLLGDTASMRQIIEEHRLEIEQLQSTVASLEIHSHELESVNNDLLLQLKHEGDNKEVMRRVTVLQRLSTPIISPSVSFSGGDDGMLPSRKRSSISDIEKSRRRSADMYGSVPLLNRSLMVKIEPRDESFRKSWTTINGSYSDAKRFDLDVPREEDDEDINRLLLGAKMSDDSLEDVQLPFGSGECLNDKDVLISRLTEKVDALSGQVQDFKEKEVQWELLNNMTDSLAMDKQLREAEVKDLRERLEEQTAVARVRSDLPNVVQELKRKVLESERKNLSALKKIKDEYDQLKTLYDVARRIATDAKNSQLEREMMFDQKNQELEEYKLYAESKKQMLMDVIGLLKQEKESVYVLSARLQDEEKKLAPYIDKLREQEMSINRHVTEKRSLETQLDLASQKLREFQKSADLQRHSQATAHAPPKIARQSSASLSNMRLTLNTNDGFQQSAFESLANLRSESTNDLDKKIWSSSDSSMISIQRPVPSGVGNYFTCEDEEGEFHNVSYLQDLKRGACNVENQLGRISELQRRNTLCRPHLKTSYPVETQMHVEEQFTDDDLKAGTAVEDRLLDTLNETMETSVAINRKAKPILPSYQKPGPPTPGRSTKQSSTSAAEKLVKTPSSIRKLFRRTCKLGTPKQQQYRVTPKKNNGNAENVPPEPMETASKVRKNIAFQLGFSPKVKSEHKSLTARTRPLNRREMPTQRR